MKRTILVLLMYLFNAHLAWGVVVANLYQANYPVQSEQANQRSTLFAQGLAQVLVKVSGNSQITQQTSLASALQQADNYVDQYSYTQQNQTKQLELQMRFSIPAINHLLQANGQAIWGGNRPLTLIWMSVITSQGTHLLESNALDDPLVKAITQQALYRGFPILFPVMDNNDIQAVSVSDIEQNNVVAVQAASARYAPDAILVISLNETNTAAINSTWSLLFQGQQERWNESGQSVNQIVLTGLDQVIDSMAARYAVKENDQANQLIQLQISNLTDTTTFAQMSHYLSALTGVSGVQVSSVSGNTVIFSLTLHSSVQSLVDQIKLGRKLLPVLPGNENSSQPAMLNFQYNGV